MSTLELSLRWVDVRNSIIDPWDYYCILHADKSRSQLKKADNALYHTLKDVGYLERIPRLNQVIDDAFELYAKKYAGKARGELKSLDPGVYSNLRRNGNLAIVPRKQRQFLPTLLEYCHAQYPGIMRQDLYKRDQSLYQRMWQTGDITSLPSRKKIQPKRNSNKHNGSGA